MCATCAWGIEAGFAGTLALRAVYVSRAKRALGRGEPGEPEREERDEPVAAAP